ncbi:MAG: flagellar basal body L-ring protein FlgH [Lautropia sp.]|nr:flagellar basal body L-ring protein FlgH [Lautropia sp.]
MRAGQIKGTGQGVGRVVTSGLAALWLAGCSTVMPPSAQIDTPVVDQNRLAAMRNRPMPVANGSIFQSAAHRGLFEDRRASQPGDMLTILIEERMVARQKSNSSVDRKGEGSAKFGAVPFLGAKTLGRLGLDASTSNSFEGKGATGSENQFSGTITVTVVEVLPNGNLVVSGDKQLGVNQGVETLKFAGVVDPSTILPGNRVSSTQVADARMQVRGHGDIDKVQTTGWLTRFFLSFMPI